MQKMDSERVESEQKLERQAQLLDTRAAKIKKLEGIYLHHHRHRHHYIHFLWLQEARNPTEEQFYISVRRAAKQIVLSLLILCCLDKTRHTVTSHRFLVCSDGHFSQFLIIYRPKDEFGSGSDFSFPQ